MRSSCAYGHYCIVSGYVYIDPQMNPRLIRSRHERDIFHDPRLRSVEWQDLVPITGLEIFGELLLPATWLAASLAVAESGHHAFALPLSFIFFLTGLRLVHNA